MDEDIVIIMDNSLAMKTLCAINDGDCALLYAYASASGGRCRVNDAALHMGFSDHRMEKAKSLLIFYKICRVAGQRPDVTDGGYSVEELLSAQRGDPTFRGVCDYLEQALGRGIRKSEIEILYGIYDRLNMPPDVIMLMINYCRSRGRLSARELEKRAYEWHDKGVVTYSAAAGMADQMDRRRVEYNRIMSAFGISGRAPSETESKYMSAWLEMGMDDDMIKMAYDRTVMRTGRLQWRYLHKILEDWHNKGYKNRRQVEQAEGAVKPAVKDGGLRPPQESVLSAVTRQFEDKRLKRERLQAERLSQLRRQSPDFAQNEVELGRLTVQKAKASLASGADGLAALEERHHALLAQRSQILASLGLDEGYISPPPQCAKCMDRGYIGNLMCECFKRACVQEEQRRKRMDIV